VSYRRLLVAPAPDQLVAALLEATAAANRHFTILELDRGHWERFLDELADRREGRRQWSDTQRGDTARVALAWWTDHVGRRHVRVWGGSSRDGPQPVPTPSRHDPRPPLWHVHPERVFYREQEGQGEWRAVCACGVAGPPEAIAWMGTLCGPCHDRREEGQPAAEEVPGGGFTHQGAAAPAFSADGRLLAAVLAPAADQALVRVHDLAAGSHRDLPATREEPQALAFSPDGALLAYTDGPTRVLVHDLSADESALDFEEEFEVGTLAFAPDGQALATGGPGGWHLRRRPPPSRDWWLVDGGDRTVTALAFSPDGQRLALGMGGGLAVARPERGEEPRAVAGDFDPDGRIDQVAFWPDGRHLACVSCAFWGPNALHLFALEGDDFRQAALHPLPDAGRSLLGPDGRLLAVIPRQGGVVRLVEVATAREVGGVGWDVQENLQHAALSPDGRTLALVDRRGGLRLVPWALLLA
jgi:hypothetical protein